jgi:uncharacterized cysteine cluster protein YcgN (CxxCxxCC family)
VSVVRLPVLYRMFGRVYSDREWEALCTGCGDCCIVTRKEADGHWVSTGIPCRYLDLEDRTCRVYDRRQQLEPSCMKVTPAMVTGAMLPRHCGYVEELERLQESWQDGA